MSHAHTIDPLFLVALGANLGDRSAALDAAERKIAASIGDVVAVAPRDETAPVGGVADLPFLNSALIVTARRTPDEVMTLLLKIESELGRVRERPGGNRTVDLDLLLWRATAAAAPAIWRSQLVTIPHPRMLERSFVMRPACAIAGDWVHPIDGRRLRDIP